VFIELIGPIFFLGLGVIVLTLSSSKAVDYSIALACNWSVPPILIGLVLVALGTDFPEIMNSILSCFLGHGSINVGDSIGSAFTQLTLVLGIIALSVKQLDVIKKEVFSIGVATIIGLILSFFAIEDGYLSRTNGFFLVISWFLIILILKTVTDKEFSCPLNSKRTRYNLIMTILGFLGIAIGTYLVINSILDITRILNISEFVASFFIAAIGTSLPELAVVLSAIRKKQYDLAIGDILGSSILDATFSIGIGPLLFPTIISGGSTINTFFYAIFSAFIVVFTLSIRGKIDKKFGAICLILYVFSYGLLFIS
jgi:cation:H+ antiporter